MHILSKFEFNLLFSELSGIKVDIYFLFDSNLRKIADKKYLLIRSYENFPVNKFIIFCKNLNV